MKTLMAAMLLSIVIFSSCTKEAPAIANAIRSKTIVVTGSFTDQKQNTSGSMTKGNDTRNGDWYSDHFRDSLPVVTSIYFSDGFADEGTVRGTLVLNTKLSGSKKEDYGDGVFKYSGTGDWYVTKTTGSLTDFLKAGAGTLVYSVIDYPDQDGEPYPSQYHIELQGISPR